MRHNLHSDSDGIDRRTALSLLSGGLATLGGCLGGSSSDSSSSGGESPSAGGLAATEGWVPPEQQSDYIRSSDFVVADTNGIYLELQLQNSVEIGSLSLIDTLQNSYDSAVPDGGEARLQLAEIPIGKSEELDEITPGENTLVLDTDNGEQRIPIRLGTSVELKDVVTSPDTDVGIGEGRKIELVMKNTGGHPSAIWRVDASNLPTNLDPGKFVSKTRLRDIELIDPGTTHTVQIESGLWQTINDACKEYSKHELEFTLRSLWADSLSLTVPVSYESYQSDDRHCGSLNGSVTVPTPE